MAKLTDEQEAAGLKELGRELAGHDTDRLRSIAFDKSREVNRLRRELAKMHKEVDIAEKVASISKRDMKPPGWLKGARRKKSTHKGVLCAMLSDLHYTEVIDPAELHGMNAFDIEIAEARLERMAQRFILVARDHWAGVGYEGVCMFSNGDLLSGYLHDLQETNEDTQVGGAWRLAECIISLISMWVEEFGRIHIPWSVGNHGRLTKFEKTKKRVRDNLDWLIGLIVAKHFKNDDRVTFDIPESIDVPVQVLDTKFLMYHGQPDGRSSGGGVGGIWPPIMRQRLKKAQLYEFAIFLIGHWHQLILAPEQGLMINGSLKGYDEFCLTNSLRPERAQQGMFLVTPEYGVTTCAPIIVADPKAEGWG